jgi:hypothetical protein
MSELGRGMGGLGGNKILGGIYVCEPIPLVFINIKGIQLGFIVPPLWHVGCHRTPSVAA